MRKTIVALFLWSLSMMMLASIFAVDSDLEICNKTFIIYSIKEGDKEIGSYSLKALLKNESRNIEITETTSMDYKDKRIDLKSIVVCKNNSLFLLETGYAETKIDGKDSMKGSVSFTEKSFSYEGKGFLNNKTGKELAQPFVFSKKEEPNPSGLLIVMSAIPSIGPRILQKEGKLTNIAFGEFPDEFKAPSLIMFKEGYRLEREKSNEKGEFEMKLYSVNSKESLFRIKYNKDDQIIYMETLGKYKFIEVKK